MVVERGKVRAERAMEVMAWRNGYWVREFVRAEELAKCREVEDRAALHSSPFG